MCEDLAYKNTVEGITGIISRIISSKVGLYLNFLVIGILSYFDVFSLLHILFSNCCCTIQDGSIFFFFLLY